MGEPKDLPPFRTSGGVDLASEVTGDLDQAARSCLAVVLLHATGFSRGVWRPIASALGHVNPTYSLDLRGHGSSSKPSPPYRWSLFADDVAAYVEQVPAERVLLCGHSLGGSTAVEVAARLPERTAGVVLIEPALQSPDAGANPSPEPDPVGLLRTTQRRKHVWAGRVEAQAHLAGRSPYRYWDPEVLAGFFATGLTDLPDGGCSLACQPAIEASIYAEAGASQAWSRLSNLTCPVRVMRATGDQGMPSTASPLIVQNVRDGREQVVEGSGHFLSMEQPARVTAFVRSVLDEVTAGHTAVQTVCAETTSPSSWGSQS